MQIDFKVAFSGSGFVIRSFSACIVAVVFYIAKVVRALANVSESAARNLFPALRANAYLVAEESRSGVAVVIENFLDFVFGDFNAFVNSQFTVINFLERLT